MFGQNALHWKNVTYSFKLNAKEAHRIYACKIYNILIFIFEKEQEML